LAVPQGHSEAIALTGSIMRLRFPQGITKATFLRDYWQRRPLLMRNALSGIQPPLTPEEMAGLACESEVESRIVLQQSRRKWELRHGPFSARSFRRLPPTHWTLLVQDLDKLIPQAAELPKAFRFIPEWRLDDLMVSYAADQGSVGPHVDTYDVFLIQVMGRRRWQINTRIGAEAPLLPDLDVRILKRFEAEHDWVLEPGDILYLPPGVAHWGIAEGPCMTCSVGYRAPSHQEMVSDWAQFAIETIPEGLHYVDPPLQPARHTGEIGADSLAAAGDILRRHLADPSAVRRWYGCFVTQLKGHQLIEPPERPLGPKALVRSLTASRQLSRHPLARFAFARETSRRWWFFASGEAFAVTECPIGLGRLLTGQDRWSREQLKPYLASAQGLQLIHSLYRQGQLEFDHAG